MNKKRVLSVLAAITVLVIAVTALVACDHYKWNSVGAGDSSAAVVSMPCLELFDRQEEAYKKAVLGEKPRFFIEALSPFGLEKYTGENGKVFGMESFGASAPAGKLMDYFGFTPEKILEKVLQHLEKQV